jgi:hypothetical protein
MRTFILGIILLSLTTAAHAQGMRYFQFTTSCGHGNWQDTAYIAATNDPAIISDVYAELGKPFDERKFVAGKIDYGHGGYNHNASHWFLWHYIPNQWQMADVAMEVCDGCPYTDLDADTAYWVRNIQHYCSWGGRPVKEVPKPLGIDKPIAQSGISFFPNPASGRLYFDNATGRTMPFTIYTTTGQQVLAGIIPATHTTVNISALQNGLYIIRTGEGSTASYSRLLVGN